jgi:hypothetical protein
MKPSCDKCGSDLIEKEVIRKFIVRLRSHYKESDIAMALMTIAAAEIADLLEKEIDR